MDSAAIVGIISGFVVGPAIAVFMSQAVARRRMEDRERAQDRSFNDFRVEIGDRLARIESTVAATEKQWTERMATIHMWVRDVVWDFCQSQCGNPNHYSRRPTNPGGMPTYPPKDDE